MKIDHPVFLTILGISITLGIAGFLIGRGALTSSRKESWQRVGIILMWFGFAFTMLAAPFEPFLLKVVAALGFVYQGGIQITHLLRYHERRKSDLAVPTHFSHEVVDAEPATDDEKKKVDRRLGRGKISWSNPM